MKILEYTGLDTSRVKASYRKVVEAIARQDFCAAQVNKSRFTHRQRRINGVFETQAILDAWQHLPAHVVRPERNKRQHLSGVLARNEIERDYAYNRALFMRVSQGWYQFNPQLSVRHRRCHRKIPASGRTTGAHDSGRRRTFLGAEGRGAAAATRTGCQRTRRSGAHDGRD